MARNNLDKYQVLSWPANIETVWFWPDPWGLLDQWEQFSELTKLFLNKKYALEVVK